MAKAEPRYGERVGASPKAVRRLVAAGWTDREIAARFGCVRETIWRIRRECHIPTTRPAPCHAVLWPLPEDVEAAWDTLLGAARFENVRLLSATTIGPVRGALPTMR